MRLRSSALAERAMIPRRFTCDDEDLSPPLDWGDAPAKTCSFVLLCDDPDAVPNGWLGLGAKSPVEYHRSTIVLRLRRAASASWSSFL